MSRTLGTVVRGVRAPIFREGDDVVKITADTVLNALKENSIAARDGDVVAITESVVARCQGNYATVEQIAADVTAKTGGETVGVIFPILSRNRFSLLLQGIASGVKKVVLMLSYPSDEVGNHLVSMDQLDEAGIDPWHDVLSLQQFRDAFGEVIHPFTGVDYVDYYKSIIEDAGAGGDRVRQPGAGGAGLHRHRDLLRYPHPPAQQAPADRRWCPGGAGSGRPADRFRGRQRL